MNQRDCTAVSLPSWRFAALMCLTALLGACAAPQAYDYTAYKQARPASLLLLPPINDTPDVKATYGVLAQSTLPLAEAGYYVFPVAVVDETFRQNGLTTPYDIHGVPSAKLREIFGADAAVYIKVKQYGTTYAVIRSDTVVTVEARIVDLRSDRLLWQGSASASSAENRGNGGGNLLAMLITAAVQQVLASARDDSFPMAGVASQRLLGPRGNGVLWGPRSPNYGKD